MSVVYLAQLAQTGVGDTKKLAQKLRNNTEKLWREAWSEWRAADIGLYGIDGIERKARLLEGWAAARRLLGEGYRNESGRRMAPLTTVSKWTWARISQQLKTWMTERTKSKMEDSLLGDYDSYSEDWERL